MYSYFYMHSKYYFVVLPFSSFHTSLLSYIVDHYGIVICVFIYLILIATIFHFHYFNDYILPLYVYKLELIKARVLNLVTTKLSCGLFCLRWMDTGRRHWEHILCGPGLLRDRLVSSASLLTILHFRLLSNRFCAHGFHFRIVAKILISLLKPSKKPLLLSLFLR